jgi:hypothetical protein
VLWQAWPTLGRTGWAGPSAGGLRRNKDQGPKINVTDGHFRSNSAHFTLFWSVYSLRRFFQNMPIFGGVYIEWVRPGLNGVSLSTKQSLKISVLHRQEMMAVMHR